MKDCRLGSAGVAPLAALPRLQQLIVSNNGVDDHVEPALVSARQLAHLNVAGNPISREVLARVHAALPECDLWE